MRLTWQTRSAISTLRSRQRRQRSSSSGVGGFTIAQTRGSPRLYANSARISGKNDVGPPYMLLRRAAIRDDRLKSMAVRPGDLYDNSCSHAESLELGSAASIEMAVGMAESVS